MSEPGQNPWLDPGESIDPQPEVKRSPMAPTGPTRPHSGLHAQLSGQAGSAPTHVPTVPPTGPQPIWIVGVHGGSGESTLAELSPHFQAAHHSWPVPNGRTAQCVLVARTNGVGLHNARAAARDWSGGFEPHVLLLGLVLIADAPGRIPKELAREITRTGGGVPRVWQLPWIEDWRYHVPRHTKLDTTDLPRPVRNMLADIGALTSLDVSKENTPI